VNNEGQSLPGNRRGTAGVSATLATPPPLREEAVQAHLHPAFLDSAFQLLLHLVDGQSPDAIAYVPVRIGRMTLLRPHAEARFARANLTRRGPRSLVAQFTLYGEDREPLAVLRDVRFRSVQLRESPLADLSSVYARAIPSPLPSTTLRAALPAIDTLIAACSATLIF